MTGPAGPVIGTRTGAEAASIVPLATTLLVGAIAALLDTTIVAVALDQLRHDLDATVTAIQWVTTSYVLAMTAVIPVVGWSVGRFGARRMWVSALGLFLAGSVLSGLAWSATALIAFRVLQGLGGGMILPLTQLIVAREAGPERFGRVMGVVGLAGQLAPVSGPVLGGLLIDTWGWRWVFLVNIPIVLISLTMTWRWFPRDEHRSGQPLDVVGLLLLPAAVVALIYALSSLEAALSGRPAGSVAALVVGAALLTAFVVRSRRRGAASLIDPGLFRDRSLRGATMMMFVLGVTTWGPMLLFPLYFQQLRGLSALDAGFALAPQSIGLGLAFLVVGRYTDRVAPRPVAAAGLTVATAATVPFVFATDHSDLRMLGLALFVRGLGLGVASLPVSVALYTTLRPTAVPGATSASTVVQRVGAACGTALTAVILQASGFASALTWMLVFTAAALAASALLPGRAPARPGCLERQPRAVDEQPSTKSIHP
ncbi:MDR family MFS transporter [Frankia sp. QA3]|uniref:MDR family MFS transporter n=1 Tax=Frankia sp. QA3 TaxID=710111 RepID=UPI000269BB74|nr:MDR family MFS transporter [Frankia sp. QA3]EIV92635.1 drug resistance transporter, EmrB/QacA subfamily [Frankia sp. QA3]